MLPQTQARDGRRHPAFVRVVAQHLPQRRETRLERKAAPSGRTALRTRARAAARPGRPGTSTTRVEPGSRDTARRGSSRLEPRVRSGAAAVAEHEPAAHEPVVEVDRPARDLPRAVAPSTVTAAAAGFLVRRATNRPVSRSARRGSAGVRDDSHLRQVGPRADPRRRAGRRRATRKRARGAPAYRPGTRRRPRRRLPRRSRRREPRRERRRATRRTDGLSRARRAPHRRSVSVKAVALPAPSCSSRERPRRPAASPTRPRTTPRRRGCRDDAARRRAGRGVARRRVQPRRRACTRPVASSRLSNAFGSAGCV